MTGEIGTWYNPKTGIGHSGPRESGDVPADPMTGKPIQKPVGGATVIEDYTKQNDKGQPQQTITISRPVGWEGSQQVTKTATGEYVYTETPGKTQTSQTQPTVTKSDLEKSKEIGKYINQPERPEAIHETAKEFDQPIGQIPKGVAIGLTSVVHNIGETVIGTPTKVYSHAQSMGDRSGKGLALLDLARAKIRRETMETVQFAREEPVAFGISTSIQLGFMELGIRSLKPIMLKTPKISTSIEIGKQFTTPKGIYTRSAVITRAGTEQYASRVDTLVLDPGGSKLSTGISGVETSRGLSAPLEHRVGVSQSLKLSESQAGVETHLGVSRLQEINLKQELTGKPLDSALFGISKKSPGKITSITAGVTPEGQRSITGSIIKTAPPEPPSMMKFVGGKTMLLPKAPVELHVQAIAKGLETQIKTKTAPKFTTGGFRPVPPQQIDIIMDIETQHIAPIGTLKAPELKAPSMTSSTTLTALKIGQKLDKRMDVGQMFKPAQSTTQRTSGLVISGIKQDVLSRQMQLQESLQLQKQVQQTKIRTSTRTTLKLPSMTAIIRPQHAEFPIKIPFDNIMKTGKKTKSEKKMDFDFEYTASLVAFKLNIQGKGKKPKKEKLFTGFEIRPVFK